MPRDKTVEDTAADNEIAAEEQTSEITAVVEG